MSSIEQATKLVKSAIDDLGRELSGSPDPKLANVPKAQKVAFKEKLQKMYDTLKSGSLPEKNQRNFGLSHAVVDGWPFDSKLAEKIAKAERAFIEAK